MADHHQGGRERPLPEALRKILDSGADIMTPALGPLDDYPFGAYGPNDEGAISFGVGSDVVNERVLIDLGKPVRSMAMTPEQAITLAESLMKHARRATRRPLTFSLESR